MTRSRLVLDPKNLAGTPPCQLLTPAQLASNRMDLPAQTKKALDAPGCEWDNKAHTREITIYVDTTNDVLHNVYAQLGNLLGLRDHRGRRASSNSGQEQRGWHQLLLPGRRCGEADDHAPVHVARGWGREEPCGPARALAEDVMANLPPLKG